MLVICGEEEQPNVKGAPCNARATISAGCDVGANLNHTQNTHKNGGKKNEKIEENQHNFVFNVACGQCVIWDICPLWKCDGGGLSQTEITDEEKNSENTQNSDSSSEKVDNSTDSSTEGKSSEGESASEETTVTVTATETAEYTYDSSGDYWYYTDGKFPQSAVTSSSTISNLQASATLTGETYAIGNETFSVFEYGGNEYIHVSSSGKNVSTASDSGTWFLVEPIVWIVGYGSSEPSSGGVAVSKDVISYGAYSTTSTTATFTSLFNSTKENSAAAVSSGSLIYSDIDTVTYDAFVSTVAQTTILSVNFGNEGDSNTTITSSGYRVASAYEIEEIDGTYSATCSNLVAYLMNGSTTSTSVAYWTRDLVAEIGSFTYDGALNNGVYVTAEGTLNNAKLNNAFGARLSTKTTVSSGSSLTVLEDDDGYYVEMGYYPTTYAGLVSDCSFTSTGETFTLGDGTEYDIYTDGTDEYIQYTTVACDSDSHYTDGTFTEDDVDCYFKIEPIKWDVLGVYTAGATTQQTSVPSLTAYTGQELGADEQLVVQSRLALESMAWYAASNTDSSINYTDSDIYSWLGSFYTNVLSDYSSYIVARTIDYNTTASHTSLSDYYDNYTTEYVWLMSYTEASTWYSSSSDRIAYLSDFAVGSGAMCPSSSSLAAYWWLRSSYLLSSSRVYAGYVDYVGYVYSGNVLIDTYCVRPALLVNL